MTIIDERLALACEALRHCSYPGVASFADALPHVHAAPGPHVHRMNAAVKLARDQVNTALVRGDDTENLEKARDAIGALWAVLE